MSEVSRFLRYTLPGLFSVFVLYVSLLYSNPAKTSILIKTLGVTGDAGALVALFLGSGVLGYLFAQVYFVVIDDWCFSGKSVDHLDVIRALTQGKFAPLQIYDKLGKQKIIMNKREAWEIANVVFWSEMAIENSEYSQTMRNQAGMYHIMHSLGGTMVGLAISSILWIKVYCYDWNYGLNHSLGGLWPRGLVVLCVLLLIGVVLRKAYNTVRISLERIVNATLSKYVIKHRPVWITWYNEK